MPEKRTVWRRRICSPIMVDATCRSLELDRYNVVQIMGYQSLGGTATLVMVVARVTPGEEGDCEDFEKVEGRPYLEEIKVMYEPPVTLKGAAPTPPPKPQPAPVQQAKPAPVPPVSSEPVVVGHLADGTPVMGREKDVPK